MEGKIEEIDPIEQGLKSAKPFLLIRGILAVLAGIVLMAWPGAGLTLAAVILGIVIAGGGVSSLVSTLRYPSQGRRSDLILLVFASLRIILGVLILVRPAGAGAVGARLVFFLAGIFLSLYSLWTLWSDPALRRDGFQLTGRILLLFLGLLMLLMPFVSAMILIRLAGVFLLLSGIPIVAAALRIR